MNPTSLLHLPPDLLPSLSHEAPRAPGGATVGAPVERTWAVALSLVAMCAAVAFALPV